MKMKTPELPGAFCTRLQWTATASMLELSKQIQAAETNPLYTISPKSHKNPALSVRSTVSRLLRLLVALQKRQNKLLFNGTTPRTVRQPDWSHVACLQARGTQVQHTVSTMLERAVANRRTKVIHRQSKRFNG